MITKIDVTLSELERAVSFAKEEGIGPHNFVTLHIDKGPVIDLILISKDRNSQIINISDE